MSILKKESINSVFTLLMLALASICQSCRMEPNGEKSSSNSIFGEDNLYTEIMKANDLDSLGKIYFKSLTQGKNKINNYRIRDSLLCNGTVFSYQDSFTHRVDTYNNTVREYHCIELCLRDDQAFFYDGQMIEVSDFKHYMNYELDKIYFSTKGNDQSLSLSDSISICVVIGSSYEYMETNNFSWKNYFDLIISTTEILRELRKKLIREKYYFELSDMTCKQSMKMNSYFKYTIYLDNNMKFCSESIYPLINE